MLKNAVIRTKSLIIHLTSNDVRDNQKILTYGVLALLFAIGVYIRLRLIPGINGDYTIYISHWYDHLSENGFSGFKDNFANYNFPYLFLLYIATLVPIAKLVAIKLISIMFDFLLVAGVYQLVKILSKNKVRAMIAASLVFFLPTVLINSAYWGQTDAIYTSFLIFTLVALFTGRFKTMWVLFGVAIAFKLQAIFLLPVLAFIWYKKKGEWWGPILSIVTFVALSAGPVFAGRPLQDALSVYVNQYGFEPLLSASVPNFYYWLPQSYYTVINGPGVLFAIALTILVTYVAILKMKPSPINTIFFAVLMAIFIPYTLPQMHDRYFYLLEILLVVVAFVNLRFIPIAIVMQGVTLIVYTKTLFGYKEVPFSFLVATVTTLLIIIVYYFVRNNLKIRDHHTQTG